MNQQFEEEKIKKQNQKAFLANQRQEDYQNYLNQKSMNKKGGKFVQPENVNNGSAGKNYPEEMNYSRGQNLPQINLPEENFVPRENNNNNPYRQGENSNMFNEPYMNQNQQSPQYESNMDNMNLNLNNQQYDNHNQQNDNNYQVDNLKSISPMNQNNYNQNNMNNNFTPSHQSTSNMNNNFTPSHQSVSNNQGNIQYPPQLSELHLSERTRKYEQQQAYKNYLDSQVSTRTTRSQSSARAYENKVMVLPPKKNNDPKVNPFSNKNYEFGSSNLGHNPILNPTNNYGYNRYLTGNGGNPNQNYKQPSSDKFQRAANNIIG